MCVVGSGGREHALCAALARSSDVVAAPGNPGMPAVVHSGHRITTTSAPPAEVEADLFVVGPETPLVAGLADRLRAAGRRVVGPGADGAQLEGSKAFMKDALVEAGVPTARHGVFDRVDEARAFLRTLPGPWVVKTDGLAAGKGVFVAPTMAEAEDDISAKLSGAFGNAGRRVVVEEGLSGAECSLLVLCDGKRVVPMVPAQDFKRLADGDRGPNTGGMGAYAPLPAMGPSVVGELMERAVEPLLWVLRRRGIDYRGVLYAGLMLTADGPRVLEYNVRFGDPEAQVVLPLLIEDPVEVLGAVADGRLDAVLRGGELAAPQRAAVCVVMAAECYPTDPRVGDPIEGLDDGGQLADSVPGVSIYHAGTRRRSPGNPFLVAGGRVLGVTAVGSDVAEARRRAYDAVEKITWPGAQLRHDIARRSVEPGGWDVQGASPSPPSPSPSSPSPSPSASSRVPS